MLNLFENNETEKDLWQPASKFLDGQNKAGVRCLFSNHKMRSGKYKGHTVSRYFRELKYAERYAHRHAIYADRRVWNWYITINSLASWDRSDSNVLGLNGVWCDIDCEKSGISLADFWIHHDEIISKSGLPYPNLIVGSGHGFYFVWLFAQQHIVHNKSFLKLWRKLEHFNKKGNAYGVVDRVNQACKRIFGKEPVDTSAVDPARVLRLVGTNNVKNIEHIKKCRLLEFNDTTYSMQAYWIKHYLPAYHYNKHTYKKNRRGSNTVPFIPHNFGPNSLMWARRYDLMNLSYQAIASNGSGKDKKPGNRENLLFYLACADSHIKNNAEIEKDIRIANRRFPKPLSKDEISDLVTEINHIDFTKYKISNAKMIENLVIKPDFQKHAKTLKSSRFKSQTIKRQITTWNHQSKRHKKYMTVFRLINEGLSFRKIHKRSGVSMGLISKIKRKYHATPVRSKAPRVKIKRNNSPSACPYFKTRYLLMNNIPITKIHDLVGINIDLVIKIKKKWNNDKGQQQLLGEIIKKERRKRGIST